MRKRERKTIRDRRTNREGKIEREKDRKTDTLVQKSKFRMEKIKFVHTYISGFKDIFRKTQAK